MLFMKMDLLNYQYLDKMNNNIGVLCYEGEASLRGEPRMQTLPVASALSSHRTGPPPISPSKRKFSMERSRSPIERAAAPAVSLHGGHLYASLPSLMEQPLALTKNSSDTGRSAVERQQNRPSVITCASAGARNCNLSHCPIAHSGCSAPGSASYRRPPSATATCDPVVDDHFAKALGDTWLQIKAAKDSASSSPESASRRGQPASPTAHMVSHSHSPSVVS